MKFHCYWLLSLAAVLKGVDRQREEGRGRRGRRRALEGWREENGNREGKRERKRMEGIGY